MQNNQQQSFHVIILAAGSGERFGGDIPKQYVNILGKSVLRHTLDNVLSWNGVCSVQVVIDPDHGTLYDAAVNGLDLPRPIHGGKTRKESINNALKNISNVKNNEIILTHDAARPFTLESDVRKLLQALEVSNAASLAHPVTDTLKNEKQGEIVDREGLWALQTPQAFYFEDLKAAHQQANDNVQYTDDTSLMSAFGYKIGLVEASKTNIKITTPDDLEIAQALFLKHTETRTGMGFDVHAFDKSGTETELKLCGVCIPHTHALKGHSDADVGLHALTDALLGTIGEGDIGSHFPPSDPAFKGMDSAIFLKHAVALIEKKGGVVQNLDLTIICEDPKIGPYREKMRQKIAEITDLEVDRISVKATTTERLGFTGRGEGIAAQAIATIKTRI